MKKVVKKTTVFRGSIRRFLVYLLALAVILPLLILGGGGLVLSFRVLKTEMTEANKREFDLIVESVNRYVSDPLEENSSIVALLDAGLNPRDKQFGAILSSIGKSHPDILGIHVATCDGRLVNLFPYDETMIDTDVSGHRYFKETLKKNVVYWAPSELSETLNESVSSLSIPTSKFVITTFLSLHRVAKLASEYQNAHGDRFVFITDQNGVYIGHPDPQKVKLRQTDPHFRDDRLNNKNEHLVVVGADDTPYVARTLLMPDTGWKVALYQPKHAFERPLVLMAVWLAGLTCLVLVFAFMFGRALTIQIANAISVLLKLSRTIGKGDYSGDVPVVPFSELAELAQSLGKMKDKIHLRETDLRTAEETISNVINSMPSILIGVSPSERVTHWNSQAVSMTGISEENAIGQVLDDVMPHLSDANGHIYNATSKQQKQVLLRRPRKIKGEVHYEDVVVYPLGGDGNHGVVIRIDDVTPQVQMEEVMAQSEKMLSVGGLAAGMAHEINNPLGGIIQHTLNLENRLLNDQLPGNIKAAQSVGLSMEALKAYLEKRAITKMIDSMKDAAERCAKIVKNMLGFSRQSSFHLTQKNCVDLLESSLVLATTDFDATHALDLKYIHVEREFEPNVPPVPCDAPKIQQVLLNILRNGSQAMFAHQAQQIAAGIKPVVPKFVLRVIYEEQHKMVRMEISDNGPGMDEDTRRRIFEPFYTTKEVGLGTGLGLSVSYFIITENHAGTLTVETELNKGSTFIIRLPV